MHFTEGRHPVLPCDPTCVRTPLDELSREMPEVTDVVDARYALQERQAVLNMASNLHAAGILEVGDPDEHGVRLRFSPMAAAKLGPVGQRAFAVYHRLDKLLHGEPLSRGALLSLLGIHGHVSSEQLERFIHTRYIKPLQAELARQAALARELTDE